MNSKLWIAPLALAAVVACRNLLNEEPQSFVTSDSFFQTEADLKSGVIAAYSPMRSGNLFNGWPWLSLELASDQVRIDHDEPNLDRKSTRLNSSHLVISYAVFCLKKKK